MKKPKPKRVTISAQCQGFNIDIQANIDTKGLTARESDDVKRALQFRLADSISKLPFSEIYVHEVKVR